MNRWQTFRTTSVILMLILGILSPRLTSADINGSVQTDIRFQLDPQELTRNDNQFTLKFEGNPAESNHYFSEVLLKGLRLFEEEDDYQWEVDVKEAYLDLYKFLSDKLDVRIGKQIIVWGKADQLNPTSNVCPDDLSDMFDFGQKLGVNAINATLYLVGDTSLSVIAIPEFTPATLPTGEMAQLFATTMDFPSGMTPRTISQTEQLPERTLDESAQFATKLSSMVFGLDVSISYFYGRDDLPVPDSVAITPVDPAGTVDIEAELIYPRMQVIGADFAGSIGSVGIWGEGALFLPEQVEMATVLLTPEGTLPQDSTLAQTDDPYVKFVLGGDYTFENGWYVNAQFLHGFIHERSKDDLNDYLVARFEKKLFHDELKIVPFGVAITVTDWDDISNNYAFVGNPELTYYPADSVELVLGAVIIEGQGQNIFSQIKDQDELYFKAKVSF